ncbi:MAG: ATPase domain-containing protein [Nitrososphaerota archaeon]|nr:AAA family ATPase [Candidatus Bathyarchaeota archaeon]MDW8062451.1 ATPase domain-containing protein [Nitrososphaerota archaeon]
MMLPGRIDTGIPGMNEILYGGIPKGLTVLLSGGPGAGKSIFAYQYLYKGLRQGEPGVLLELEDYPARVRMRMHMFGWDVKPYEDDRIFAIVDCFTGGIGEYARRERYIVKDPTDTSSLIEALKTAIREVEAERVVVDAISTLYLVKPEYARQAIIQIKRLLVGLGCTSLLVWQKGVSGGSPLTTHIEHMVDGVIKLDLEDTGEGYRRILVVSKMTGTKHSIRKHTFEITDKGIIVQP